MIQLLLTAYAMALVRPAAIHDDPVALLRQSELERFARDDKLPDDRQSP